MVLIDIGTIVKQNETTEYLDKEGGGSSGGETVTKEYVDAQDAELQTQIDTINTAQDDFALKTDLDTSTTFKAMNPTLDTPALAPLDDVLSDINANAGSGGGGGIDTGLPPKKEIDFDLQASSSANETRSDFNIDLTTVASDITHLNLINARSGGTFIFQNIFLTNIRVIKYAPERIGAFYMEGDTEVNTIRTYSIFKVDGVNYPAIQLGDYKTGYSVTLNASVEIKTFSYYGRILILLYKGLYSYYFDITEYKLTNNINRYILFCISNLYYFYDISGAFLEDIKLDLNGIVLTNISNKEGFITSAPQLTIEDSTLLYDMSHRTFGFTKNNTRDVAIDLPLLHKVLHSIYIQPNSDTVSTIYDTMNQFYFSNIDTPNLLTVKITSEANAGSYTYDYADSGALPAYWLIASYYYYYNDGNLPLVAPSIASNIYDFDTTITGHMLDCSLIPSTYTVVNLIPTNANDTSIRNLSLSNVREIILTPIQSSGGSYLKLLIRADFDNELITPLHVLYHSSWSTSGAMIKPYTVNKKFFSIKFNDNLTSITNLFHVDNIYMPTTLNEDRIFHYIYEQTEPSHQYSGVILQGDISAITIGVSARSGSDTLTTFMPEDYSSRIIPNLSYDLSVMQAKALRDEFFASNEYDSILNETTANIRLNGVLYSATTSGGESDESVANPNSANIGVMGITTTQYNTFLTSFRFINEDDPSIPTNLTTGLQTDEN